jgi:hypothetical protein
VQGGNDRAIEAALHEGEQRTRSAVPSATRRKVVEGRPFRGRTRVASAADDERIDGRHVSSAAATPLRRDCAPTVRQAGACWSSGAA